MDRNLKSSQSGSAMVMALLAIAVIAGLAGVVSLNMNHRINESTRGRSGIIADSFLSSLGTVLSRNESCVGFTSPETFDGLSFVNSTDGSVNKTNFSLTTPSTTVEQDVQLTTNFKDADGNLITALGANAINGAKANFADLQLTVDRLFLRGSTLLSPNVYRSTLLAQVSIAGQTLPAREIGDVTMTFGAGNQLISCQAARSARAICEEMNCKWNADAEKRKCSCGFPSVSCPSTSKGRRYISGIDTSKSPPEPICADMLVSCASLPGRYLAGIDDEGDPICQPVEGTIAGAPSSPPTPTAPVVPPAVPPTTPPVAPGPPTPTASAGTCTFQSDVGGTEIFPSLQMHDGTACGSVTCSCYGNDINTTCFQQTTGPGAQNYWCKPVACGSSTAEYLANPPTSGLCADGSSATVTSSGSEYEWMCSGHRCMANRVP